MLTFNLKKEWFEKIKSGEKTHEYREEKYYWTSKIVKELFNPKNKEEHKHLIELFLTMLRTDFHYKCLEFHNLLYERNDFRRNKTENICDNEIY